MSAESRSRQNVATFVDTTIAGTFPSNKLSTRRRSVDESLLGELIDTAFISMSLWNAYGLNIRDGRSNDSKDPIGHMTRETEYTQCAIEAECLPRHEDPDGPDFPACLNIRRDGRSNQA